MDNPEQVATLGTPDKQTTNTTQKRWATRIPSKTSQIY